MQLQRKRYTAAAPQTTKHTNKKSPRITYFFCSLKATFPTDLSLFVINFGTLAIQSKLVIFELASTLCHEVKRKLETSEINMVNPRNTALCYLTKYFTLQNPAYQPHISLSLHTLRNLKNWVSTAILGNAGYV